MKTRSIILCMVLLLLSCSKLATNQNFNREALLKEAKTVTSGFMKALEKVDTTSIFSILSNTPETTLIMGDIWANRDEFIAVARKFLGALTKQTLENGTEKFLVIDPKTFIYCWKGINKTYNKSGEIITYDPIILSYTFQKEEAGWKVIHGHESWVTMKIDSSMVKK